MNERYRPLPMTELEQAHFVYDLLVVACGATEYWRGDFVQNWPCREYRCCGKFGSGGKFYNERSSWRVGCYREDETPERVEQIVIVNRLLATMRAEVLRGLAATKGDGE